MKWRIPKRGRYVSIEPQVVAPDLVGAPLSTFRRRLCAFLLDMIVFGVLILLLFTGLTLISFRLEDPEFITHLRTSIRADDPAVRKAALDSLGLSFATIAMERREDLFDPEVRDAIRGRDMGRFLDLMGVEDATFTLTTGRTRIEEADGAAVMRIGGDMLLGDLDRGFSWMGYFVAWFTLWTWIGRGRTFGKWVFGLRIVRLDGRRLGLWNCFSRAGGYGASSATAMLGFLEAIWHPNRQALHDKISSTVVVRGRG